MKREKSIPFQNNEELETDHSKIITKNIFMFDENKKREHLINHTIGLRYDQDKVRCLIVKNLSKSVNKTQINSIFSRFGKIYKIKLIGAKINPSCLILFEEKETINTIMQQKILNTKNLFRYSDSIIVSILNGNNHFSPKTDSYKTLSKLIELKKRQWNAHFIDGNEKGKHN